MALSLLMLACGSPSDPGGHGQPPILAIGDTVEGRLRHGEVDSFRFTPSTSGAVAIYIQALDSNLVEMQAPTGVVRASYVRRPSLEANRTPILRVAADSTYFLTIYAPLSTAPGLEAGRYRLRLTMVDTLPESSAPSLPLAANLSGETLSNSADVDVWTLGAPIGDTLGLVLRAGLDPPGSSVPVIAAIREYLSFNNYALTLPGDTVTVQGPLITSLLPVQFSLRVQATDPGYFSYVTPVFPTYHVSVAVADLRPESRPAIIGLADSLTTEAIDSVGDVDTYKLPTGTNPAGYVTGLRVVNGAPDDTLEMLVVATDVGGGGTVIQSTIADTALLSNVTAGVGQSDPGLTVRVTARHLSTPLAHPTYRFAVLAVNTAPEAVPAALAPGDTVSTEQIDFAGDVDDFTIAGTANQVITADMALPASFGGPVLLDLIGVGSTLIHAGDTLGTAPLRVTLPSTGTFTLRVKDLAAQAGRGFYRLTLH